MQLQRIQVGYQVERGALVVICVLIATVLTGCGTSNRGLATADPAYVPIEKRARVPDEYLVTLVPEADRTAISERFGNLGIKNVYLLDGETFLLILTNDPGPRRMEELIYDDSRIRSVHPNLIYWANRSIHSEQQ